MKISFFILIFLSKLILGCGSSNSNNSTPSAQNYGTISAKFNSTAWSGAWAAGILGNFGGTQIITISGQESEKVLKTTLGFGITNFSGPGTYNYGGATDKVTFSLSYANKGYSINEAIAGGGTGTIKVTEFTKSSGLLNPGKVVGTFSGTIKNIDSGEMLTITEGKFSAKIVL